MPDEEVLQRFELCLVNEPDTAFRGRARNAFRYLDPQPGERILDCGCGLGYHLKAYSTLIPAAWHGIDRNATVLAAAQREVVPAKVTLARGDVLALPYADESFDKVLSVEVLEHLPDDRRALREIYRVLKRNGMLVMTVPYMDYPFWYDPVNWVAEHVVGRPIKTGPFAGIWTGHLRLYDESSLLEALADCGFAVQEHQLITHTGFLFTHNLVYEVGKRLLQGRYLPAFVLDPVDRFSLDSTTRDMWNPMTWFMNYIDALDRRNQAPGEHRRFVNLVVKAVKWKT